VTRLLKQEDYTKTISIIAVTAYAMPGDEKKALDCGCDAYIAKPISLNNLLRTIESMLSTSPPAWSRIGEVSNCGSTTTDGAKVQCSRGKRPV
jgi:DNA-binding response OmpR family regulator